MECALGLTTCTDALHAGGKLCAYHKFALRLATGSAMDVPETLSLTEVRRRLWVDPPTMRSTNVAILRKCGTVGAVARSHHVGNGTARARLAKFLRLLNHMQAAPWANKEFETNRQILMRLTAAHLPLIAPGGDIEELCQMIDPQLNLVGAGNLVWVTNRQQGKTTTLARFLAAISIASPVGGLLCTVYSTSLERSQELVKAAKEYIRWMQTTGYNAYPLQMERDNESRYVLNNGVARNEIIARPRQANSCRGDAPHAAIFDEVGFISSEFWTKFAFPLMQVTNPARIFTCATTPPPPNGFFNAFIAKVKEQNKANNFFFNLINHSLACQECLDGGDAIECCHNLAYLPPWKSMVTMQAMRLLSKDGDSFEAEVYGIVGSFNEFIPRKLITAAENRAPVNEPFDPAHIWIAIDPASHTGSEMGIVAFGLNEFGVHVILGLANVKLDRSATSEVQIVVRAMLRGLREHPLIGPDPVFVPIIECNNNDVLANSMLSVFEPYGPIYMPFERENFRISITPGIGVWMSKPNKLTAIMLAYQAYFDGRISFAEHVVVADRDSFHPKTVPRKQQDLIALLGAQLNAMRDQPDGSVSGKDAGSDDVACAFLLGIYWSQIVRAKLAEQ